MSTQRRRRAHLVRSAVAGLVVALAAACSVPSDDQARAIDPARLAGATADKQSCASPGLDTKTIDARIYLVRQKGEPPDLAAVPRVLSNATEATPFAVLNALVNCRVTEEDKRNGLASALPGDLQLLGVDPVGDRPGVYEVRLGALTGNGGQKKDLDKLAVAQIFFTLTDPDVSELVRELRFTIAGRPVAVSTDNRTVSVTDTVRRDDFGTSIPGAGSTSATFAPSPTAAPSSATSATTIPPSTAPAVTARPPATTVAPATTRPPATTR